LGLVVGKHEGDGSSIWNGAHIDLRAHTSQRCSVDQGGSLGVVAIIDEAVISRSGTQRAANVGVEVTSERGIANEVETKVVPGIGRGRGHGEVASKCRIADAVKGARIAINTSGGLVGVHTHSLSSNRHGSGIAIDIRAVVEVIADGASAIGFAGAQSGAEVAGVNVGKGRADSGENLGDERLETREIAGSKDEIIAGQLLQIGIGVSISSDGYDVDSCCFGICSLAGQSVCEDVFLTISEQDNGFLHSGTRRVVENDSSLLDSTGDAGASSVDIVNGSHN
jgi:hypothetical protein